MLRLMTIFSILLISILLTAQSQQLPGSTVPPFIALPPIPSNLAVPQPGEPSSFPINKIRQRRSDSKVPMPSSSVIRSSSSSMTSSEEKSPGENKRDIRIKPEIKDTIKPTLHIASLNPPDLPEANSPVTFKFKMNDTRTERTNNNNNTNIIIETTTSVAINDTKTTKKD